MYARILVPVDGSEPSKRALAEAIALGRTCQSAIVLLHVVEYYPVMIEMATASTWELISDDLHRHGQGVLDAAHREVSAAGLAVESHLVDASASRVCDVVVDQARAHRCDLIVMGTHGRRGLNRALVGSDAELVIRQAPVPVLLVRTAAA